MCIAAVGRGRGGKHVTVVFAERTLVDVGALIACSPCQRFLGGHRTPKAGVKQIRFQGWGARRARELREGWTGADVAREAGALKRAVGVAARQVSVAVVRLEEALVDVGAGSACRRANMRSR